VGCRRRLVQCLLLLLLLLVQGLKLAQHVMPQLPEHDYALDNAADLLLGQLWERATARSGHHTAQHSTAQHSRCQTLRDQS